MGQLGSDSRRLWGNRALDQLSKQDQLSPPTLQRAPASPQQEPPMTTPSALPGFPRPYTPGPPRPYMPGPTGPYMHGLPGPYPHPPYGQPPQPPKKGRTWLIVLLVILAGMGVGIVECAA